MDGNDGHWARVCRPFLQVFEEGAQLAGLPRKGHACLEIRAERKSACRRSILVKPDRRDSCDKRPRRKVLSQPPLANVPGEVRWVFLRITDAWA